MERLGLISIAALLLWATACKRPGTDRALQCERYSELYIERQVACGGDVDGVKLTTENADGLAIAGKLKCMNDEALTPTKKCLKQLMATPCQGPLPSAEETPACFAKGE